jgi:peptide/nickel transport system substrate-binding protein
MTPCLLPRPDGAGLLLGGIDGKVQLAETGALKPFGTRDWGSDFAAAPLRLRRGTQIIASGSGEALTDSLRAYELPALEAIPASAPLAMDGTVTALWTAPDGKSVLAIVRKPAAPARQTHTRWTVLRQLAISCLVPLAGAAAAARTRPHYGGTLRVEVEGDPWQRPGGLARRWFSMASPRSTPTERWQPALAVEWKSENDNHRWQFRLRPACIFTMARRSIPAMLSPRSPRSAVQVAPGPASRGGARRSLHQRLAACPICPNCSPATYRIALVAPETQTGARADSSAPAHFSSQAGQRRAHAAANENCWQGRPFLDCVEIHAHRSIRDQWLDLSVGRADLVEVPAEQLRQAHEQRLNVVASPPVSLLALTVSDSGALANPQSARRHRAGRRSQRALQRNLSKAGRDHRVAAARRLTGYAFLFSAERDLNKAHELRGGASPSTLTLAADGARHAACRAAHRAQPARRRLHVCRPSQPAPQHADLTLRTLHSRIESAAAGARIASFAQPASPIRARRLLPASTKRARNSRYAHDHPAALPSARLCGRRPRARLAPER